MREAELRDAIYAYVEAHDFVTFAALHKEFAGDARETTEISPRSIRSAARRSSSSASIARPSPVTGSMSKTCRM